MKRFDDRGVLMGMVILAGAVLLFGTMVARAFLGGSGPSTALAAHEAAASADEARAERPAGDVDARGAAPGEGASVGPASFDADADGALGDRSGTAADAPARNGAARDGARARPAAAGFQESLPPEVLRLAVQRAPFSPDRRPPAQPYRMPNDPVPAPTREEPELPPPPDFRLLATIAGPEGGVAVVQVGDEAPRILGPDDELMGYRLAEVDGGRAVMSGQGRDVSVFVADPTPTVVQENDGERRNRREREREAREREREIQRALEQRARQFREAGHEVQVDGDRIIITGPDGQQRILQFQQQGAVRMNVGGAVRMNVGGARIGGDSVRMFFQQRGGGGG